MKTIAIIVSFVFVLLGCGADEPIFPDPASGSSSVSSSSASSGGGSACECPVEKDGSRILRRNQIVKTGDGLSTVETLGDYFDASLGIACSPRRTKNGDDRCLPDPMNFEYHSDPGCKQPLVPDGDVLCGGGKYVSRIVKLPDCGAIVHDAWIVGGAHAGDPVYFLNSSHECLTVPNPGGLRVLDEVPATEFAVFSTYPVP